MEAGAAVVPHTAVDHKYRACGGNVDAVLEKVGDRTILDVQCLPAHKANAVETRTRALEPQISQSHNIIGAGCDHVGKWNVITLIPADQR